MDKNMIRQCHQRWTV